MNSSPRSAGAGNSSSPSGTVPTIYSPTLVRDFGENSRSASRRLVNDGSVEHQSPVVKTHFIDEYDPTDNAYISRYLLVTHFPDGTPEGGELEGFMAKTKNYGLFNWAVPLEIKRGALSIIRVRFDDIADACEGRRALTALGYGVEFTTARDYATTKLQDPTFVDDYEGNVKISVGVHTNTGHVRAIDLKDLYRIVYGVAKKFGNIHESVFLETDNQGVFHFRFEFESIDASIRCIKVLNALVNLHREYQGREEAFYWNILSARPYVGLNRNHTAHPSDVDSFGRLLGFQLNPLPPRFETRNPHEVHNRVTRDGIEMGTDVRTTVMLRNIPNKMDWMNLKHILDKWCFGEYDFMYLRIDFSTGSNVGYAFINFLDTNGVLRLLLNLEQGTWPGYQSLKHAEISYATIQGREALVQKFRNSSVMHESYFCRPRLFLSFDDALSVHGDPALGGTEVCMPEADNPQKLQRSMDSARSAGLYAPNGVTNGADHRNRSSMYDRGTPRDQMQTMQTIPHPNALAPWMQQVMEAWHYATYNHWVGYNQIPPAAMDSFMSCPYYAMLMPFALSNPGVIGRPAVANPNAQAFHGGYPGYNARTFNGNAQHPARNSNNRFVNGGM